MKKVFALIIFLVSLMSIDAYSQTGPYPIICGECVEYGNYAYKQCTDGDGFTWEELCYVIIDPPCEVVGNCSGGGSGEGGEGPKPIEDPGSNSTIYNRISQFFRNIL